MRHDSNVKRRCNAARAMKNKRRKPDPWVSRKKAEDRKAKSKTRKSKQSHPGYHTRKHTNSSPVMTSLPTDPMHPLWGSAL
ncbi:hypothetical protein BKA56DRAFT_155460 [Ilyonectria sp. MPI-CAGE-AT-0026]|nr:hypothetical protein BKA56DRAFT_155460 [Ilyonectria sp. MPI-CAGE-AT-0026]